MDFNTKKFEQAVQSFKNLCGSHVQLFQYGQFYVTETTRDYLSKSIVAELNSNLRLSPSALKAAIDFFSAALDVPITQVNVGAVMTALNTNEVNGDLWAIRSMFTPNNTDAANARKDFDFVWSTTDISASPALSYPQVTLGRAQAAFALEKDRCFQVLRSFAKKLLTKQGVNSLPSALALSAGQVGGAALQHMSPATATETGRDTIVYNAPAALAAAVTTTKAALDAGGYVHCGVLSGAVHEHSPFPQPEHHILVFAHDSIDGQDAFLFWDPDAGHSSIDSTPWGTGFGVLFSRPDRLSTSIDEADLAAIDRGPNPRTFGNHAREPTRHCYQVYSVTVLPERWTVRLHTKILQSPVRSSIDAMLQNAVEAFAAHGIEVIEVSREIVDTAGTDDDKFQTLFVGDGQQDTPTAELTSLHETLRSPDREFGVEPAANEMVIAFVRTLVPASTGCALHPEEKPGAVLSATLAGEWALASQIGRLLGLGSGADSDLLSFGNTDGFTTSPPGLAAADLAIIEASPLTTEA